MNGTIRLVLIGALAVVIVGGAYAVTQAIAGGMQNRVSQAGTPVATHTGTPIVLPSQPSASTPVPALVQVWSQFCVGNKAYTLLSLPENASFQMGVPVQVSGGSGPAAQATLAATSTTVPVPTLSPQGASGANSGKGAACVDLGVVDGRRLVLCRAIGATRLTMSITGAQGAQGFIVDIGSCGPPPVPGAVSAVTPYGTVSPVPTAMGSTATPAPGTTSTSAPAPTTQPTSQPAPTSAPAPTATP